MGNFSQSDLAAAFETLERPLYNFALRWVWNRARAEELVQDAFVRIWARRNEIDGTTVKALLYKTVQNLCFNELRNNQLRELPLLEWVLGGKAHRVEADFLRQEGLEQLRAALERLPRELRETLLLCEFSDLSQEQIGATLGIPAGTVASRRNRAMSRLKELTAPGEKTNAD